MDNFDNWCREYGGYLNDSDDAAKAARLMARNAWNARVGASPVLPAVAADFEEMTWTFQISPTTPVGPGRYAIVYVGPLALTGGL